jgi:3-oxoacyl-[acyl-carrier-protein] synthase II
MAVPRVVITGMGGVTPIGTGLDAIWESARMGRSGIGPITVFDASKHECRIAGEVRGFEAQRYMPTKHLKRMDDFSRYAVASSVMAVEDAKLEITPRTRAASGYCSATTTAERARSSVPLRLSGQGSGAVSPFYITAITSNMASAQSRFDCRRGPNFTIGMPAPGLNGRRGPALHPRGHR